MLYSQNDLRQGDSLDILDSLDYLDESDCNISPESVPICYSLRLDQEMIQLESMIDYALSIDESNVPRVINEICKANNAHTNKISFMVNEQNLYDDKLLSETVHALRENGYLVNIKPISSKSIYYTRLQEALITDNNKSYEDSEELQSYLNENFIMDAQDKLKNNFNRNVNNMKQAGQDIANKYAAISKTIREKYQQARELTGQAKETILRQIDKLKNMANNLRSKAQANNN